MNRRIYAIIFTVLVVLGVATSFSVGQIFVTTKYQEVDFTTSLVAKNIEMRIDGAKSITELAAEMPAVAEHNSVEAEAYLKDIVDQNPEMWSHFLITDKEGTEIAHTEGAQHYGKSLAERDYYFMPWEQGKTTVAQPIHSVSTGRKIIAIGVPTYKNGERNGVLVGFIHLSFVSTLLNENNFSPNSYLFMTNSDGTISAHINEAYVLEKNISEMVDNKDILTGMEELRSGIQLGKVEKSLGLISYAPIGRYNLSIASFIPFREALITPIVIAGVLLIIFTAIIFLVLFWKRMENSVAFGKKMENRACTDNMTGLKNRYWLDSVGVDFCCEEFLTAIFFDIDDFKLFNDNHNHAYGDEVLKFVGKSLTHSIRPSSDVCIRYAGDEFVILLKDTPVDQVLPIAERLMAALKKYQVDGVADPVYISCGIASAKKGEMSLHELIAIADNATYQAKRAGKNTIFVAERAV